MTVYQTVLYFISQRHISERVCAFITCLSKRNLHLYADLSGRFSSLDGNENLFYPIVDAQL